MPTPILHAAVGAACARADAGSGLDSKTAALFVTLAVLPDVDLIPGLLIGDPVRYHHQFTHSLAFGAALALAAAAWRRRASARAAAGRLWLMVAALSHPLLDLFTYAPPGSPPDIDRGLWLAWPLSRHVFGKIYPLLEGPYLTPDPRGWFTATNMRHFGAEAAAGLALFGLAWLATRSAAPAPVPAAETTRLG